MNDDTKNMLWKIDPLAWAAFAVVAVVSILLFKEGLQYMVTYWETKEEYSHGYMIPVVVLFLIWQKKTDLERIPFLGSWVGFLIVALGTMLFFAGNLSALYIVIQYAFVVVVAGLMLAFMGWQGFKLILIPLVILVFMIPLPEFIFNNLSAKLQLVSSQIGVWIIHLFGISVYLEGNVIDLGTFKLQVVEACSGLRYLFPLMTLGFIAAYFFKVALWKRAVVFLSSIPITVLMNSFRIGVIGVLVNYWGSSMAEGFLHDFEGWVVFMASTGLILLEMWILARLGKEKRALREVFGLEFPDESPQGEVAHTRTFPKAFTSAAILLVVVTVASAALPKRIEITPQREDFSTFPMSINGWHGRKDIIEQIYIDVLKFDDYIIADYDDKNNQVINFYVAYYASQKKGQSAHSPRSCIPGDGWEIKSLTQRTIAGVKVAGQPLEVNRTVIQKGEIKQLVYYWFQQRGRVITNEYMVKIYLFWDALTKNRTDGSLVRLTTLVKPGEDLAQADAQLTEFARAVNPEIKKYVPE